MMNTFLWVVIVILWVVIVLQEVAHRFERKDLYNRIMARNLQEYKAGGGPRTIKNIIAKNAAAMQDNDRKE